MPAKEKDVTFSRMDVGRMKDVEFQWLNNSDFDLRVLRCHLPGEDMDIILY